MTPGEPDEPDCARCDDSGAVIAYGRLDACLDCARAAEAEYRLHKETGIWPTFTMPTSTDADPVAVTGSVPETP